MRLYLKGKGNNLYLPTKLIFSLAMEQERNTM